MDFRIHHIAISVRDMNESIAFYQVFGFQIALNYSDPAGAFEITHLKLGDRFLELWCFMEPVEAPRSSFELSTDLPRIGVKHLALEVPSLDEARAFVESHGIPVPIERRQGNTGVAYFFVRDPSGNLLEILEDKRCL